jgi:excisionase family DNA binding protein
LQTIVTAESEAVEPIKAYRVGEACRVLSISKSQLYRELAAGRLRAKKAGAITLIPTKAVDAWLEGLPDVPAVAA